MPKRQDRLLNKKIPFRFFSFYIKIIVLILIGISLLVTLESIASLYNNHLFLFYHSKKIYKESFMLLENESPYVYIVRPHIEPPTGTENVTESINNFSMRRKTDTTETPLDHTVRILSYGDSIGFGLMVNDEQNYPHLLEDLLNRNSLQNYDVLNMYRGYCPSIYAMHLKKDLFQFKPQWVIMEIELSNDISDEAMVKYSELDKYGMPRSITQARYWPGWQYLPPMSKNSHFWGISNLRIAYFNFNRQLHRLANKIYPNPVFSAESDIYYYSFGFDEYYFTEKRLSQAFDRMFDIIKAEQRFCNDNKAGFLLIIVPSKFTFYENQYRKGAIRLIEQAEVKAQKRGIPYISLRQSFQDNGGSDLYFDFCHPTPKGYEVIAKELFRYFRSGPNFIRDLNKASG